MRAWELEATPSVCNGCATGCNVEIHHKNGRAWRLVPAPQPGRQRLLDVRRGSVHVSRPPRGAARRRARSTVCPPAGIARSARQRIGSPSVAPPVSSRSCSRALHTNEDNFALAKLAQAWGVTHVYVAGEAAGARARRWPPPRRRHQPEPRRRQGDRRGARHRHDAGVRARPPTIRGDARARRRAARRRSGEAQGARVRRDHRARARSRRRTRRSRCPSPTGPRSPARSRTTRVTCSACTRRSRRRARRSPAGKRSSGSRRRRTVKLSWSHAREVFKDMTQRCRRGRR